MRRTSTGFAWILAVAVLLLMGSGVATAADSPKIDLNTASLAQLMTLDRIGEVVAQRILAYRDQNGPFAAVEDLMKVKGVGPKVFDRNKDRITVSAPAKQ